MPDAYEKIDRISKLQKHGIAVKVSWDKDGLYLGVNDMHGLRLKKLYLPDSLDDAILGFLFD